MYPEIKQLKSLRKKLGLTQQKLATELEISISTLNRWESEKYVPSSLGLSKIKHFLQTKNKKNSHR